MERTNCASRADQTRHSAACAKAFLLALACAPRQADQGAGPRPGTEAERLVLPCRPRLSAAAPPPIHRGLAYRALHHRARRCPRAVSCASHERPRHRREGPPRRAAAEPLPPSPSGSSSRTSRLHQRASGRPPRCRVAAEPSTPWPGASTVASTRSTDCRPQSQAIGATASQQQEANCPRKERPRAVTRVGPPMPTRRQSTGKEHAHRARRLPTLFAQSWRPIGVSAQHSGARARACVPPREREARRDASSDAGRRRQRTTAHAASIVGGAQAPGTS